MDLKSHGPVPRDRPSTKHSKRGRRALREAVTRPRKPNVIETLSVSFLDTAMLNQGYGDMYLLWAVSQRLVGADLIYTIPRKEFKGGVYENRSYVHDHRGYGFRKFEFWSHRFLVLECEFQLYETARRTWVTTKAYAPLAITWMN